VTIPPNLFCQRNDCEAEFTMRAMEATRQGWVANGERKPQSRCDYHHKCKTCGDLKSWERDAEGVVKKL